MGRRRRGSPSLGLKSKSVPFERFVNFADISNSIAKYTVASVQMLDSNTGNEAPCRTFRIPTATYSWEEVIDILSRIQGKEYTCTYRPNSEALALAEKYASVGDADLELGYSLKAILGDEKEEGVPKPWDHDKFPDIQPESLEVSLRRFFGK
jgi:hypothetical protein